MNLDTNQAENGGKTLEAEIILSREEKVTLANYIIDNVYVEDGVNGLYYHDGVGTYTNAELEAGDNSYRFAGGDYEITDSHLDTYSHIYNEIVLANCDNELQSIGNVDCDSGNLYFTLAYDSSRTQYSTMESALENAIEEGYITKNNVKNNILIYLFEQIISHCLKNLIYRLRTTNSSLFFLYNHIVINMKIYLDLVFMLNFIYDLLLMMTVDITLKRHTKLRKLIFSAILGALSLAILFLPCGEIILFILKVVTSALMILIAFGYKNIKYFCTNMIYLYMTSVILGGFLYFLNVEFSYKREGMVFYFDGMSVNYILLLIIAPVILFLYVREHKRFKSTYNYNYRVSIVFKNGKCLECNGFLDTGNKLKDPITKKYVVLVNKKVLVPYINIRSPMYVTYKTVGYQGLIECFSIRYIKVNNQIFKNYLVGIIPEKINLNGSDCLLNYKLMEDINV